jgi:hypothetical protein
MIISSLKSSCLSIEDIFEHGWVTAWYNPKSRYRREEKKKRE